MAKVLLLRHAQTTFSKANRFTGASDIPLNETGTTQAQLLSDRLQAAKQQVTCVYSSSLRRSVETADIIARRYSLPVQRVPAFNELDYGLWEGLTRSDVLEKFPDEYKKWLDNPGLVAPPGGETGESVAQRAMPALSEFVAQSENDTIIIVAHKAVNRVLICLGLGIPLARSRVAVAQEEACLNVLVFDSSTGMLLKKLNDTSHYKSTL